MVRKRLILWPRQFWERALATPRLSFFRRGWTLIAAVAAVALCGYFGWRHFFGDETGAAGPVETDGLQKQAAIPVTIAQAKKADFPVYLNGLGVVEPYQTVLVRSRVDGEVTKIAFKQGQMVKEGDVLVEIDPRPYQAALDQAVAKKAQDEASSQERAARLGALCHARQGGFRCAYEAQYAAGDGRRTHRADQRRPGVYRQRPDAGDLYDNPISTHGEDGLSPRRRRQHRARG